MIKCATVATDGGTIDDAVFAAYLIVRLPTMGIGFSKPSKDPIAMKRVEVPS